LEQLLLAIGSRLPVDVYIPELPSAADSPAAAWRARLEAAGVAVRPAPETGEGGSSSSALHELRARLFTSPDRGSIPADDTVRLVSAPDPSREVKAAARACLAWGAEGVPFWEMA